jgi:hypothetical protein
MNYSNSFNDLYKIIQNKNEKISKAVSEFGDKKKIGYFSSRLIKFVKNSILNKI